MTEKTKTRKPAACKLRSRGDAPETRDERRARLAQRRLRQLARQPGFIRVPNRRVDGAIATQHALLMMSGRYNPIEAMHEARRVVARSLPSAPMERRILVRPHRQDDPEYRRGNR